MQKLTNLLFELPYLPIILEKRKGLYFPGL